MTQVILGKIPSKSNGYKIVKFGNRYSLAKSKQVKDYEKSFAIQYKKHPCIEGDFTVQITVYFENKRPDLDGASKIFFDCLQTVGAIKNDRHCQEMLFKREIDKQEPRIEFKITPINANN